MNIHKIAQRFKWFFLLAVILQGPVLGSVRVSALVNDYQFSSGFSSTQGQNQWYYKQWNGSSYSNMTWYPDNNYWRGSCQHCIITQDWQHPDSSDAVIAWQAPRTGNVAIRGIVDHRTYNVTGDGVQAKIMKQSSSGLTQIWPSSGYQDILPNFSAQYILKESVTMGDMLYFHLNKKATNGYDATYMNPRISYDYEPKFTLDNAELVMNPSDFGNIGEDTSVDVSLSVIENGTNFDFYHSTENGRYTEKFSGSLSQPAQTSVYDKYPFTDGPYSPGGEWWWISNMYKTPDGNLLAFCHIENVAGSAGWWALGLAYSTDGGDSFVKLGKILTNHTPDIPPSGQGGTANIYGIPYVIKDGYFYIYYGEPRAAVARAAVSDVLSAASSGTVSTWNKFYSGNWNEPALGGNFTPIIPSNAAYEDDFATHGDAAYSTYLDKYLLSGYTHHAGKGVFLTFSDNGTGYETPSWIQQSTTSSKSVLSPYITIVDVDGSDNGEVGQSFYVYYSYRFDTGTGANPSAHWRWLYRQKVTLNQAGFDKTVYNASTDFSPNQGDNGWYYYQYDGTTYSEMGWDLVANRWKGIHTYNIVGPTWQHPDTHDSVRAWKAPRAGTVTITADSNQVSVTGGPNADGVKVKLLKNTANVWPSSGWRSIAPNDAVAFSPVNVNVSAGDILYFQVNQNVNIHYDTVNWAPTVTYQ